MQMIMRIMPLMLMFFTFTFPTGVVLYWLTTNVWTIAQQRVMIHGRPAFLGGSPRVDEPPPKGAAAKAGNSKKDLAKPVTPKKELPKTKTSPGGKTSSAATRRSGNKKKKR